MTETARVLTQQRKKHIPTPFSMYVRQFRNILRKIKNLIPWRQHGDHSPTTPPLHKVLYMQEKLVNFTTNLPINIPTQVKTHIEDITESTKHIINSLKDIINSIRSLKEHQMSIKRKKEKEKEIKSKV